MSGILLRISPNVSNDDLNTLFTTAWENHHSTDFQPILSRSLLYICAYDAETLVGFVNIAWDGGIHGFILDTTVHSAYQRRGIGAQLVKAAVTAGRERGLRAIHVDYEPHLGDFYRACGFKHTEAGLILFDS
jgi:GNAT superfamily N-acetyltransferase